MSIKEARLDFRLAPEAKARIERAAKLTSESVSAFVVQAAISAADDILAREDVTVMPAEQFDALMAALDTVDSAPALTLLGQRDRRYVRK